LQELEGQGSIFGEHGTDNEDFLFKGKSLRILSYKKKKKKGPLAWKIRHGF